MLSKIIMPLSVLMTLTVGEVKGASIDPFTFCTNTCTASQCTGNIKEMCKKTCAKDGVWEQVASLELNKSSREFRQLRDKDKKAAMLYSSEIAKCLDLKDPKLKEEKPKGEVQTPMVEKSIPAPTPAPAPMPSNSGGLVPNVRKDLCGPAVQAEIEAFQDKSMVGRHDSQIKDLESALKGAPEAK